MTLSRYPLRVNVGFLVHQLIGSSHDFSFDYPAVQLSPDFQLTQFSGTAHISRTPQGLLVEADFTGNLQLECVRCLDEYQQAISTNFAELFAFRYRRDIEFGTVCTGRWTH